MVQVVERNSGAKETICSNCNSRLKFMPSEAFDIEVNRDFLGDSDTKKAINCPVCRENTVVDI